MCGDIPNGTYKVDVTLTFPRQSNNIVVPLTRQLSHVEEVRLYEYVIDKPNCETVTAAITAEASTAITVTFTAANNFVVGDTVFLKNLTGVYAQFNNLNFRLTAVTAANFTIASSLNPGAAAIAGTAEVANATQAGGVFRLTLGNSVLELDGASNLLGDGMVLSLPNPAVTHVHYSNPRTISTKSSRQINSLDCRLTSCDTNRLGLAKHTGATFFLSFICRDPMWTPDFTLAVNQMIPQKAAAPFSTKGTFL